MTDPAAAWEALEEPWRVCFELAWEALGANTIPVGSALVDGGGEIVATGRNRVYELDAPVPQIANSLLAHAEVNALVGLDPERRYEDHVLYSSLESCVLCVGATVMATVGRIRFAATRPARSSAPTPTTVRTCSPSPTRSSQPARRTWPPRAYRSTGRCRASGPCRLGSAAPWRPRSSARPRGRT
jgi:tRNA(Arg) A34 adenosine deaminase TadA